VAIVSQSVAQRLFPNGDAVNRKLWWTDSLAVSYGLSQGGARLAVDVLQALRSE